MDSTQLRSARPEIVKALIMLVLLVTGFLTARSGNPTSPGGRDKLEAFGGALIVLLAGIVIVRLVASATRLAMERHRGDQRGAPLGLIVAGIGYLLLLLAVLSALRFKLDSLLLGGALTGVIIGIAAQQTLSNFFAGILLMLVRPFNVGDRVVLRSTLGEYEGIVGDIDFFYVKITTRRGLVELPTANVLASAIGPGARSQDPQEPDEGKPEKDGAS
ncbi:MAG: mechanosensitive ion channel family protein [Actinomycetota bacterium]|nr:mechanosensitive ion channel family protein [Actinomycetota bacterium]